MIDGDLFDLLEKTARIVRASVRPFGGIQLIVSGDFFQLPPVKKHGSAVDPKFAFEAESWEDVIDHKRELTHVYRQSDSAFIAVLNEIRRGVCSNESLKLLKTCVNRSFSTTDNIAASQLFTHRADVDALNTKMLNGLEGEVVVFTAKDAGQVILQSQLNQFARGKIELKVGTQVVLNKSIRSKDGLVNGARGVVTKFINSVTRYPVVRFANGVEAVIKTETWTIMSGGKEIASRSQIPLDHGWALSIHKSQGMTLDRVSINLCKVFEFGQSYVALSRAKSLEGLCIQNYINAQCIKAHPKVIAFYQSCL
jgi:ATP-dependent DNA helicase PIF1